MIAILIITGQNPDVYGIDEHTPLCLFPLVDRPILHHIVEYLVTQGVRRFEFIVSHLPEKVESSLGNGARWGCTFGFHLYPRSGKPYKLAQAIAAGWEEGVVLGKGDYLPELPSLASGSSTLFFDPSGKWTGWAIFPEKNPTLFSLDQDSTGNLLPSATNREVVERAISFEHGTSLLQAQQDLLSGKFPGLMVGGRQVEPGIWISRNVSLHPTAKLTAPIFIGPNCRIERGVQIGPAAIISENCIVDKHSSMSNAVIAGGSYVGQALELDGVVVDRNCLLNTKIGTSFLVSETFLLGSLTGPDASSFIQKLFSRAGALLLILTMWPVALLVWSWLLLTQKIVLAYQNAVKLPAEHDRNAWHTMRIPFFSWQERHTHTRWNAFLLQFLPGLVSALKGELLLVGVLPRSSREIQELSKDWQSIYLKSKAGLITEASVVFGEHPTEDELYTAEAYYGATRNLRHDVYLILLYFWRLLFGLKRADTQVETAETSQEHTPAIA